ncbi:uncharacterized protein LOC143614282 [Bidens hawaiensis]|uniref:uncharacterized protein LOC143614282 n=1 Tax=Bidens hawaiensis TaxID=980011 RepID=UPI00404A5496
MDVKRMGGSRRETLSGKFKVKGTRRVMANGIYGDGAPLCEWENWVPIKIDCFIWRLLQNRILVAPNLIAREMSSLSSDCRAYVSVAESMEHVFLDCDRAKDIWRVLSVWCGWDLTGLSTFDHLLAVAEESHLRTDRHLLKEIIYSSLWFIWKPKNELIFKTRSLSTDFLVEEIQRNFSVG